MTDKPKTGLRRPSSVDTLRAAASAPAPLAASPPAPLPPVAPVQEVQPQQRAKEWPVRIPLNVDEEMRRALEQARVDDRIETTSRVRAMIQLWQDDDEFRARVNELAATLRPGGRAPRS